MLWRGNLRGPGSGETMGVRAGRHGQVSGFAKGGGMVHPAKNSPDLLPRVVRGKGTSLLLVIAPHLAFMSVLSISAPNPEFAGSCRSEGFYLEPVGWGLGRDVPGPG